MAALSFERKRTAEHRYRLTFRYFSAPYSANENRANPARGHPVRHLLRLLRVNVSFRCPIVRPSFSFFLLNRESYESRSTINVGATWTTIYRDRIEWGRRERRMEEERKKEKKGRKGRNGANEAASLIATYYSRSAVCSLETRVTRVRNRPFASRRPRHDNDDDEDDKHGPERKRTRHVCQEERERILRGLSHPLRATHRFVRTSYTRGQPSLYFPRARNASYGGFHYRLMDPTIDRSIPPLPDRFLNSISPSPGISSPVLRRDRVARGSIARKRERERGEGETERTRVEEGGGWRKNSRTSDPPFSRRSVNYLFLTKAGEQRGFDDP